MESMPVGNPLLGPMFLHRRWLRCPDAFWAIAHLAISASISRLTFSYMRSAISFRIALRSASSRSRSRTDCQYSAPKKVSMFQASQC